MTFPLVSVIERVAKGLFLAVKWLGLPSNAVGGTDPWSRELRFYMPYSQNVKTLQAEARM